MAAHLLEANDTIFDFYPLEILWRSKYFEVFGSGPIVSFYHLLSRVQVGGDADYK